MAKKQVDTKSKLELVNGMLFNSLFGQAFTKLMIAQSLTPKVKLALIRLKRDLTAQNDVINEALPKEGTDEEMGAERKAIMNETFAIDFQKIDVNMIAGLLSAQEIEAFEPFLGGL